MVKNRLLVQETQAHHWGGESLEEENGNHSTWKSMDRDCGPASVEFAKESDMTEHAGNGIKKMCCKAGSYFG